MIIANHLVDPNDIKVSWSNIAGLENVVQELKETVILPIQRKELFEDSQLTQAPKVPVVFILQFLLREKFINMSFVFVTFREYCCMVRQVAARL